jgi:hypothetical protein
MKPNTAETFEELRQVHQRLLFLTTLVQVPVDALCVLAVPNIVLRVTFPESAKKFFSCDGRRGEMRTISHLQVQVQVPGTV